MTNTTTTKGVATPKKLQTKTSLNELGAFRKVWIYNLMRYEDWKKEEILEWFIEELNFVEEKVKKDKVEEIL